MAMDVAPTWHAVAGVGYEAVESRPTMTFDGTRLD